MNLQRNIRVAGFLFALGLGVLPALAADSATPQMSPAADAHNVNPDTHLVLTFASAPAVGHSGQIRIYDLAGHRLVDTLDLSIPAGPDPAHRVSLPREALDPNPPTPTTTTPAVRTTPPDLHQYQVDTIGGLADFHFFPVIIHGNVATIYPHHNVLAYHHRYAVEIDPGALPVADGSFTGFTAGHPWTFSTRNAPPRAGATRVVVAADGTGDFNTVQGAIDFIPAHPAHRVTVSIRNGNYEEIVFMRGKSQITFAGEDRARVLIGYGNNSAFNPPMPGPSRRCAFSIYDSTDIELTNLTVSNYSYGQAEGLLIFGARNTVRNVTVKGSGDALNLRGPVYFVDSSIIGDGDTILGVGPAFFRHCEISSVGAFMWIRNTDASHGNVFVDCTFVARPRTQRRNDSAAAPAPPPVLARLPNNHGINYPYAEAVLIRCRLIGIAPEGWGPIDGDTTHVKFMEFASTDGNGAPLDVSHRHPASRQLATPADDALIAQYSNPASVLGGWSPAPPSVR